MATLTSTLDTDFTPAAGDFIISVKDGPINFTRQNSAGAPRVSLGFIANDAKIVSNPVAGAIYRFSSVAWATTATVQADQ